MTLSIRDKIEHSIQDCSVPGSSNLNISDFVDEMIMEIFQQMEKEHLPVCLKVCKRWNAIVSSNYKSFINACKKIQTDYPKDIISAVGGVVAMYKMPCEERIWDINGKPFFPAEHMKNSLMTGKYSRGLCVLMKVLITIKNSSGVECPYVDDSTLIVFKCSRIWTATLFRSETLFKKLAKHLFYHQMGKEEAQYETAITFLETLPKNKSFEAGAYTFRLAK